MAQTYTLEEAVRKLGIPKAEFQRRLNEDLRHIRPMRDGTTLRFRAHDIDELARSMGQASDPELILADSAYELEPSPPPPAPSPPKPAPTSLSSKKPAADDPLNLDLDDLQLAPENNPTVPAKPIAPKTAPLPKASKPADEEPLVLDDDFQVTLEPPAPAPGPRNTKLPTGPQRPANVVDLDLDAPLTPSKGPGSSGRLNKPAQPKPPATDEALVLDDDNVDLGAPQRDVTGHGPDSGIGLRNPVDSGISLESAASEDDFDLDLDSVANPKSGKIVGGGPKSGRNLLADSDSEFELNLDDLGESAELQLQEVSGHKDIFETNFDVQSLDESGSQVVPLEESAVEADSDFDLDLEVSEAEVEIEEVEEAPSAAPVAKSKPSAKKKAADEGDVSFDNIDLDDSLSASKALRGAQITEDELEEAEEAQPVQTVEAKPASWGVLPLIVMFPCLIIGIIASLMGFELVRGQWGYTQPYRPTSFITRTVAESFKDIVGYDIPKE